jgi:hypothetical protein
MRINRRVSKEDGSGRVVLGGNYDTRRTACSHDQIYYIDRFRGLTKSQADSLISPLLEAPPAPAPPPAAPLLLAWVDVDLDDDDDDEVEG